MSYRTMFGMLAVFAVVVLLPVLACSGQPQTPESTQFAEQAPPPPAAAAPAPPPPAIPPAASAPRSSGSVASIPEERPRRLTPQPPPEPATVTLTIPQGSSLPVVLAAEVTSETAMIGDAVTATLKEPIVVGDRVVYPAGSIVEGKVTDVKPATKGFKDTSGALAVAFDRIIAPDGRKSSIVAGFTKVAEGSGKKKAAIIGGSAAGGALLGKVLGKDAKGAAVIGGAIGTAVAGGTKGKEAILAVDEEVSVTLEQSARATVKR